MPGRLPTTSRKRLAGLTRGWRHDDSASYPEGRHPYGDIEWDSPEELARRILEHIDLEGHGRIPGERT